MKKILVINGPNLNFLGIRDTATYGRQTYEDLAAMVAAHGSRIGAQVEAWQSNHEGAIIDRLQQAYYEKVDGIVINPGAFTHYSYAIRDAIASVHIPAVEVHISNVYEREDFRKISVTKPVCIHQIYGKGLEGYLEAIDHLAAHLEKEGGRL